MLAEFENIISDCLEKVVEKDEIISFSRFKINELTAKLSKASGSDKSDKSPDYKLQIEKLNQEITALKKQQAVST